MNGPAMLSTRIQEDDNDNGGHCDTGHANSRGEPIVAQVLPEEAELARMCCGYRVCATTAVASVVALPTTTAQVTLWNGEPSSPSGKTYLIGSIYGCLVTASRATTMGFAIMLSQRQIANPAGTLLTIRGTAGQQQYNGRGIVALARTGLTNDGWFPVGNSLSGAFALANAGLSLEVMLRGGVIVPPGHAFHMACLTSNALNTVRQGLRWYEVLLPVPR